MTVMVMPGDGDDRDSSGEESEVIVIDGYSDGQGNKTIKPPFIHHHHNLPQCLAGSGARPV